MPGVKLTSRAGLLGLVLSLILIPSLAIAQTETVVHAVLFYSSSCIHCQQVIQETLPALRQEFGPGLDLLLLDVANPQMADLFEAACGVYAVDEALCGSVPSVIIGPRILIGSDRMAAELPGLIQAGLAAGGISLPDLPGMQAAADYVQSFRASQPEGTALPAATSASFGERLLAAPVENGLMLLTLGLLIGSPAWLWRRSSACVRAYRGGLLALIALGTLLALSLLDLSDPPTLANAVAAANVAILIGVGRLALLPDDDPHPARSRLVKAGLPALVMGSLLLSGYMTLVEVTHHEAYCGPIGDCLRVQQSPYAWLFGWLPVGGLGVAGGITLLAGWIVFQGSTGTVRTNAGRVLAGLLGFGLLFSTYLTFVELAVIGTMCAWCLTSALLMLLLFWIYWPAARALRPLPPSPSVTS